MSGRLRVRKLQALMIELEELITWASLEAESGGHEDAATLENLVAARIGIRRVLNRETEPEY